MKETANHTKIIVRLGLTCLILVSSLFSLSWHFGCIAEALRIGGLSFTFGMTFDAHGALYAVSQNGKVYKILMAPPL